jgi:hypothetical protein
MGCAPTRVDGFVYQRTSDLRNRQNNMATLGCQIAPSYNHEEWDDSSGGSTDNEGDDIEQEQVENDSRDLDKAETVKDPEMLRPSAPTPLQNGRTRSFRRPLAPQPEPVGFWHWSMVRLNTPAENKSLHSVGRRQITRSQAVASYQ